MKKALKENVLDYLYENIGKSISGEEIARELGVSRNSVWRAVNQLKDEGYKISSQTNTGYILSTDTEIFNEHTIKKHLKNDCKVFIFDELASSNSTAKEMALECNEGDIIIAKKQSDGRGRMGRSFISNGENGLYMSIILKPRTVAAECVSLTVMGAVAVLDAIEATSGKECSVKWVNDIYINERKVCGILTEASIDIESGGLHYAVLGIGVNITEPQGGFDRTIADIAGAVYDKKAPHGYKSVLCQEIINRFFDYYKKNDKSEYMNRYREKSNIIGKEVEIYRGDEVIRGTATDIDENANLVVLTDKGSVKFSSGDARVRKQNGK